jgi:DNA-binding PadR family transcriptional regulator
VGNVILGLLMLSPHTLYALNKQFEQSISLFYSASLGSLRSALIGLLERDLVSVSEHVQTGRNKKTYVITESGRDAFLGWLKAPIVGGNIETVALSKVFFLGMLSDAASRVAVLDDIVERISADERELVQLAAQLDTMDIPAEFTTIFRYQRHTLDYGLQTHRVGREFFERLRAQE